MARAVTKITNPDSIEVTISFTLTVANWKNLRKQIDNVEYHGPAHWLREAINDLTRKVERELDYTEPEDETKE